MKNRTYECCLDAALALIGGKWKFLILWNLASGPRRFGELRRRVAGISEKMLIQELKEMELHLVADIRIASADVRFGQDENTHGRFPGGGSTIRFVREACWGNAMRYMLTGDHWGAEEALRMGVIQEIAPDPGQALEAALAIEPIAKLGWRGELLGSEG
jgi:hypothetical protein